jgi:hypothetical protein
MGIPILTNYFRISLDISFGIETPLPQEHIGDNPIVVVLGIPSVLYSH